MSVDFANGDGGFTNVTGPVSFQVRRGEIFALVGESGCGKSVTSMAIAGLLPRKTARITADSIRFCSSKYGNTELFGLTQNKLRRVRGGGIAYIFQEPSISLNPVFRIGDQIAEVLALHRLEITNRRAEVVKLLDAVGIPAPDERADAFPHELSGGMQQRVMIAMGLAGNPELLVADEPTTALDVTIQAQILELLDRLRRERDMGIILITHNLGIVSSLADVVAVMYAGHIAESAPADKLFAAPQHPYTRALLNAVPKLGTPHEHRLSTIPGNVPPPEAFAAGCRFCGRCAEEMSCCRNAPPLLREVEPLHYVACFKSGGEINR
ncbi:MAG: ABC transporter ATP-binding protein [Victivallaceae bacterium]|nr:ABC transporter ATP-binding protein [Victivallaceae bacterium]